MPIQPIARNPELSSDQLTAHANTIAQVLRNQADATEQVSNIGTVLQSMASAVAREIDAHIQAHGAPHIHTANHTQVNLSDLSSALQHSQQQFGQFVSTLQKHAQALRTQLETHQTLMTGFPFTWFTTRTRVVQGEWQANRALNRAKIDMDASMASVEQAENDLLAVFDHLELARPVSLSAAAKQLSESL